MQRALAAVALFVLALLLIRAARLDLAGDYLDPVTGIKAQDEALYSSSAIHMATRGKWLTPEFMDRLALYKPPLLIWLSAASARIAGISRVALRFPIALLCALAAGLVFFWTAETRSWQAGACAVLLLASNHLWHALASLCLTDGLLVAFYTAAMYCLFADPWLESRAAFWGYAASVAAAILTKSVAGVLPLGILGIYWLAAPRKYRPTFLRLCAAAATALALAAPWYIYQLLVHHGWFWTEHVLVEILGYGGGAPPQTTQENQAVFYLMRLLRIDPILTALAIVAVPALFADIRRRSAPATLLAIWIGVIIAAVLFWQYRNVTYLLPLMPPLAILGASYGRLGEVRSAKWLMAVAIGGFVLKLATPTLPWGIPFRGGTVVTTAPMISRYCQRDRGNELILVEPQDELFASVLPLPKVRYSLIAPMPLNSSPYSMDFASMGIVLSATQFNHLDRHLPAYRRQLHDWGIDTTAPVGTMILAADAMDLAPLVQSHPNSDFFLPDRYREAVWSNDHEAAPSPPGYFFLLSRHPIAGQPLKWSCNP